jgi:hypothetical protein
MLQSASRSRSGFGVGGRGKNVVGLVYSYIILGLSGESEWGLRCCCSIHYLFSFLFFL